MLLTHVVDVAVAPGRPHRFVFGNNVPKEIVCFQEFEVPFSLLDEFGNELPPLPSACQRHVRPRLQFASLASAGVQSPLTKNDAASGRTPPRRSSGQIELINQEVLVPPSACLRGASCEPLLLMGGLQWTPRCGGLAKVSCHTLHSSQGPLISGPHASPL